MAMSKAERAEMEKLREELAFRWPTEPEPVRTVRASDEVDEVSGWDFNLHNREVFEGWSERSYHGRGVSPPDRGKPGYISRTQGSRSYFATRAEAFAALRWALCRDFAAILHIHDQRAEKGE